jgi:hypothetical protein
MFPVTKRHIFFQVRESVQASHSGPPGREVCVQSVWQTAHHQALFNSGWEVQYCTLIHSEGPPGGEVCMQSVWQTAHHQSLSNSGMDSTVS